MDQKWKPGQFCEYAKTRVRTDPCEFSISSQKLHRVTLCQQLPWPSLHGKGNDLLTCWKMKTSRVLLTSFLPRRWKKAGERERRWKSQCPRGFQDVLSQQHDLFANDSWLQPGSSFSLQLQHSHSEIQGLILRDSSWNNWRSDSQICPGMF